jgi:hypothetical protein
VRAKGATFHLLRSTSVNETGEQINDDLIASHSPGSSEGAEYKWVDAEVEADTTYFYWLEAVDMDGTITRHGSASATVEAPTAVTVGSVEAHPTGGAGLLQGLLALGTALAGWFGWRLRRR